MKRDWTALAAGIGLGAGAAYLLDPDRGRRRRARLRDQAVHAGHVLADAMDTAARDLRNRTRGLAAETAARLTPAGEVPDEVLVERVRSAMGRAISHPHAIHVESAGGRITLHGPVLACEEARLRSAVAHVRGVRAVESRLEVHESSEGIPALQGGVTRPARHGLARTAWPPATRLVAGAAGGAMAAYGAARRDTAGAAMGLLGLGLLARSITNEAFGQLTGLGAGQRGVEIRKTVLIAAAPDEVYAACGGFARAISTDEGGEATPPDRWHISVPGPVGIPISLEGEITEAVPNRVIAWRSAGGAGLRHEGRILFEPEPDRGTRVDAWIGYTPPAGTIGQAIVSLLGADPERMLGEYLARFKALMEDGRTTVAGRELTREDLHP